MGKKKLLNSEQKKELQSLIDEIIHEAKEVKLDYEKNQSDISGSVVSIHENSPYLDTDDEGQPLYSGSRLTKVLKSF